MTFDVLNRALQHEFTHLADEIIATATNYREYRYVRDDMKEYGITAPIEPLLYCLWDNSEINAWRVSHMYHGSSLDNNYFEVVMRLLAAANKIDDMEVWKRVRDYCNNENGLGFNGTPAQFKDYFIKTSFRLIKKMVRKYY